MSEKVVRTNQQEEKKSFFRSIEAAVSPDKILRDGLPASLVPKVLFVAVILLFYIGNTHYAERTIRKIGYMKVNVDDLRADYTTLKAELMFSAKQSEIAKKVKSTGLKENSEPPKKIVVQEK